MFLNDPVRQTPNIFSVFILLLKRSLLQISAVSNYRYIGSLPQELCLIMPMILHPYCKLPLDNLQNLATFMILGLTFCGIYNSSTTFGCEKVVYWREISSGMSAIPYFAAWSSGSNPTLTQVKSNSSYARIRWLWEISAQRWAIEAAYLKEIWSRAWHEIHDTPLNFTYKFDEYNECLRNICLIALCWFLLAFLALKLINRDKQK
ncbi:4480_t:CDS:2 [Entrophospora sp. SA101]|nr:4480_t:CDS:2 [Entrophospora sp. SA101]